MLNVAQLYKQCKEKYDLPFVLKSEQSQVLQSLINMKNTCAVLPTGFGKSLCFMLYPLLLDELYPKKKHVALVILPLKSLTASMLANYTSLGIRVASVQPKKKKMERSLVEGNNTAIELYIRLPIYTNFSPIKALLCVLLFNI